MRRAENAILTAQALVAQRESEKATAEAVVHQRRAELTAAQKRYQRTEALVARNALPRQQLDDDTAAMQSAQAALAASRSQVLSAEAGIAAAKSQVIEAQSALEAARANVARLQADISDSELKTDRVARVQYRVAQPGEVLPAGGKLLNTVDGRRLYDVLPARAPRRPCRHGFGGAHGDRCRTAVCDPGQNHLCRQRGAVHAEDGGDRERARS